MKSIMTLMTSVLGLLALASFSQADELSDVQGKLFPLKKEYRKFLPKIDRFNNPKWKEANMASIKASAAVGKMIDTHPDLEELRQKKAKASAAYQEARKGDNKELTAKLQREAQDASGALHREGFKLQEVKDLQAASIEARRKVEAIQYDMVAALGGEAKEVAEKLRALEIRYRELLAAKEKK
ncbi:hypothetical protein NT6N_30280 [Oceaniferula spumae]|uniref:Uncharacterized protein n=1 Tax=Oceaniferula spumae TaxID=2979115 RepID=A0AAT9FPS2_9BACT